MNITHDTTIQRTTTLITNEHDRLVRIKITVDTYTQSGPERQALLTIYPDIVLSGCGGYSRQEFQDVLNALGSTIDVSETQHRITFTVTSIDSQLQKTLALFQTMLQEPTFRASELQRVKTTMTNQLTVYEEEARPRAHELLQNMLFTEADRRFSTDPKILRELLPSVTKKALQKLHQQILMNPWVVSIAGRPSLVAKAEKTMVALQVKPTTTTTVTLLPSALRQQPEHQAVLPIVSKQNIEFSIGATLPIVATDTEYPAFVFGLSVLGLWGGFVGRLMSIVREQEGLTYGIYATTETTSAHEPGYWRIMTFFAPDSAAQGITSTRRELQRIAADGITKDEHIRLQQVLATRHAFTYESSLRLLGTLHGAAVSGLSPEAFTSLQRTITEVKKQEVDIALATYLQPQHISIAAAGPLQKPIW